MINNELRESFILHGIPKVLRDIYKLKKYEKWNSTKITKYIKTFLMNGKCPINIQNNLPTQICRALKRAGSQGIVKSRVGIKTEIHRKTEENVVEKRYCRRSEDVIESTPITFNGISVSSDSE